MHDVKAATQWFTVHNFYGLEFACPDFSANG
jgi:hypothetical protein